MQIIVLKDDQQLGPFTVAEFHAELDAGTFSHSDQAWHEGLTDWVPIDRLVLQSTPPPPLPRTAELVVIPKEPEPSRTELGSTGAINDIPGFPWWPITRWGSTTMAICLLLGFFFSLFGGLAAVILFTSFIYLGLTALRFGIFKVFGFRRPAPAQTSKPVPFWRHPVAIGSAVTMVLVLCIAILSSGESARDAESYRSAWQQNQNQYAGYNSTGKTVERYVESFARGMTGEFDAGVKINREIESANNEFAQRDAVYSQGYAYATQSQSEADAVAGFAILGLIILACYLGFKLWRRRRKRKSMKDASQPQTV